MKPLIYHDKIYGKVKITSPVILELINSSPMQRLKRIAQFGVPDEFYHKNSYSRFEHSLGVYIILKTLRASEEEQVAGLLHDISHTAFSHVIDYVLMENQIKEDYQDKNHKDYILNPETSNILKKHKLDPSRILNHDIFPLLEKDIPQLCADRIDYALREFPLKTAKRCFMGLNAISDNIIFNNRDVAFLFAKNYINVSIRHWGSYEAAARYRLFANVLRSALKENIIDFTDFKKDDKYVVDKLKRCKNKKIQQILEVLRNKSLDKLPKRGSMAFKKFRHVDPLIYKNGKFYKLSRIDPRFENLLKKAKELNKKGIKLPKITALG